MKLFDWKRLGQHTHNNNGNNVFVNSDSMLCCASLTFCCVTGWRRSCQQCLTFSLTMLSFHFHSSCFHIAHYRHNARVGDFQIRMLWVLWNKSTAWSRGPLLPLQMPLFTNIFRVKLSSVCVHFRKNQLNRSKYLASVAKIITVYRLVHYGHSQHYYSQYWPVWLNTMSTASTASTA